MQATNPSVISLDIGGARIGIALASLNARLPHPLMTLPNDDSFIHQLSQIIERESIQLIVVGLPRNLQGDSTKQTESVMEFVQLLKQRIKLPIYMQDEALTSIKAESELRLHGQKNKKADIDSLAATLILEDYLGTNEQALHGTL